MELVIMAAGLGSRFGGLKQLEPIDENGNFIIDYSIFDAITYGFDKIVFVIKEENYEIFHQTIGSRIEGKVAIEYVFQKIDDLPDFYIKSNERTKPWGTGHAVRACRYAVKNDFMVINADDFYGSNAYKSAANYLKTKRNESRLLKKLFIKDSVESDFALIGYKLGDTLSSNGSAKRGICMSKDNMLTSIVESEVEKLDKNKILVTPLNGSEQYEADNDCLVSMNAWVFTPKIFDILESAFKDFLESKAIKNPLDCEFFLPTVIGQEIAKGLKVEVLNSSSEWFGITYKKDKTKITKQIEKLCKKGLYPTPLWK